MATTKLEISPQRLDTRLVGRAQTVTAWQKAISPAYECEPLTPDEFEASLISYNLDGLMVRRVRFGRARFTRTRAMVRDHDIDSISIGLYLAGSLCGRIGDHELRKAPDRITFEDLCVPCEGLVEASEVLRVVIPRDRIASCERLGNRRPVVSLPLNAARGSLLAVALRGLWDDLRAGRVYEPAIVAGAFVGLVNGLIEHGVEAATDRQPQALMEYYLREHLGDPTLGPEHLQRAFNYSRSAIYRRFEHHGGVAAFIRAERLRRCYAELIRSTTPGAVSVVAARYGFSDASHFSRIFHRHYGIAPSHLVATAAHRPSAAQPSHARLSDPSRLPVTTFLDSPPPAGERSVREASAVSTDWDGQSRD